MTGAADSPTVLIVPGLRDHVEAHWQTVLASDLEAKDMPVRMVPPMGREDVDCVRRVAALEEAAQAIEGPLILVAHSAGCLTVAHWACRTRRPVRGALLAAPPDFEVELPEGYPSLAQLRAGGWLPVPRRPLPFHSIVATSRNDPLCRQWRANALGDAWDARIVDVGEVGHLNPASGYGRWPLARDFITDLAHH